MFGIGVPEMVVILVVALIVLGPKRLPEVARALGKGLAEFRKVTGDVNRELEAARSMIEAEAREHEAAQRRVEREARRKTAAGTEAAPEVSAAADAAPAPPSAAQATAPAAPAAPAPNAPSDAAPATEPKT